MMAIRLGAPPLAGFDQPLEMLQDCHRRIEHFLDVLRKVEQQFGEGTLPEEGRRALVASIDYFANAAPRHTADEEESLFPRMRQSELAGVQPLMADLDRLEGDHRRCRIAHALVDQLVRAWLDAGCLQPADRDRLRATLDELADIYAAHIQLEDQRIFPVAAQVLEPAQVREIGAEMRDRRSLGKSGPASADG